ncbi:MAG: 4Fe-4S binding protein [Proteobacteria bacterium]|nr:4Fe-4S binding protein [Pseudomonadota bacterium]
MNDNLATIWNPAAQAIIKAGKIPIIISDTVIELLQTIMTEEQARFISAFDKPSLNLEQLQERTGYAKSDLEDMLKSLMYGGIVVGTKSRTTGIQVYRLLGPFPGLFEYTNLKGETSPKHRKLALLFDKMLDEMKQFTQEHYELYVTEAKKFPPVVRVVPVEEEVGVDSADKILPLQAVSKIVDKFDDIALAHCYCRHSKDLLDDPCQTTSERLNCLLLGKSALFATEYEFAKTITKEQAKQILEKASDDGLVHKAFHIHLDKELDEEAICNCCQCCCGPFQMYYRGVAPYHCHTKYLAQVNFDDCTACETCIPLCPIESISMQDSAAFVDETTCIGCGICVHHCPDQVIQLLQTEERQVFLPPKRID